MSFSDFKGTPFEPFIPPIIPKDAPLSPHSSLTPDRIGKIPGVRYKEGWGGFPKAIPWQLSRCSAKLLDTYAKWYQEGGFVETVGILSRLFPGIDIDFDDPTIAAIVEEIAVEIFGATIVRVRPNSGKRLLMYRFAGNSAPLLKIRRVYRTPFEDQGAIELLAHGQQYLIEGMHISDVPYEWVLGLTPVCAGIENIPVITAEQADRFFKAVDERFRELDFTLVKGGGNLRLSGIESAKRTPVGPTHSDLCPDLDMLKDLLTNYLPVDHVEFTTYDEWAAACVAIVTACGKDESFYPFFEEWCNANPENVDQTRAKWESVRDSAIGWSYLCNIGHEYGYCADVQMAFKDLGELEQDPASTKATSQGVAIVGQYQSSCRPIST